MLYNYLFIINMDLVLTLSNYHLIYLFMTSFTILFRLSNITKIEIKLCQKYIIIGGGTKWNYSCQYLLQGTKLNEEIFQQNELKLHLF